MGAAEELYSQLLLMSESLQPESVKEYVESHGWIPVPGVKGAIWAYDNYSFGRQILIPKARTEDYDRAIYEVLIRLELCEKRSMCDIARDMQKRRKVGLSFKVRLMPYAEWQKRPAFSRRGGYFVWGFIWLNFSREYDD